MEKRKKEKGAAVFSRTPCRHREKQGSLERPTRTEKFLWKHAGERKKKRGKTSTKRSQLAGKKDAAKHSISKKKRKAGQRLKRKKARNRGEVPRLHVD